MDPVTGQGISDAFRDAETLAEAVAAGLDGGPPLERGLADYQARRDAAARPMFDMTVDRASFPPPRPDEALLLSALAGRPAEITRFFGMLAGAVPAPEYFGPRNLLRVLGPLGLLRAGRARRRMRT
jgi:2-polyprenyl-6-methoxyphenol hydroxylase-like FAD-dependent oxidoreductase